MITELKTALKDGQSYLLFFDLPPISPDRLAAIDNSASARNLFTAEYQKTTNFDLLDSAAKNPGKGAVLNQLVVVIKVHGGTSLQSVAAIMSSLVFMLAGAYIPLRFRYAEESSVS